VERALRAHRGGISGLRRLLREHGEAIEADLRRHYRVRLSDLHHRCSCGCGRPDLTLRELGVYLRRLPVDSETRTVMNGGKRSPSGEALVLGDVVSTLRYVIWAIQAKGLERKDWPPFPSAYTGWWEDDARTKTSEARVARIEDARRRAAERRRQIAAGQIA
jgi:hypothetical protein